MTGYSIQEPIFGKWYIEEEIGSGAFGTVYRIKREDFEKTYYSALKVIRIPQNKADIKILRAELGDDDSLSSYYTNFVRDFAKEIELMSALKGQTNIVSYEDHDFIQDADGIGWTVLIRMELLMPFADYQLAHDMSVADTVKLGTDICTALSVCENRNIIHRDIKLGNIFISDNGDFKLGDFGIARELEKTTGGLSKKGTYSYMAPEVYLGKPYNSTVDIYSLGIVLYRLLNHGRTPFLPEYPAPITFMDRENSLKRRISGEEVPAIKGISPELNAAVRKACAYDPKERYATAAEMKAALQEALSATGSAAETPVITAQKSEPAPKPAPKPVPKPTQEDEKTASPFREVVSDGGISGEFRPDETFSASFKGPFAAQEDAERTAGLFGGVRKDISFSGEYRADPPSREPEKAANTAQKPEAQTPLFRTVSSNSVPWVQPSATADGNGEGALFSSISREDEAYRQRFENARQMRLEEQQKNEKNTIIAAVFVVIFTIIFIVGLIMLIYVRPLYGGLVTALGAVGILIFVGLMVSNKSYHKM